MQRSHKTIHSILADYQAEVKERLSSKSTVPDLVEDKKSLLEAKEEERLIEYKKVRIDEVKSEEIGSLEKLIRAHFSKKYDKNNPYQLLIVTHNGVEGIGDYIHLLDFMSYMDNIISSDPSFNLSIKGISFVHKDRINLIPIISKGKVSSEALRIYNQDEKFNPEIFKQKYIIWTGWEDAEGELKHEEEIKAFVRSHPALINLSYAIGAPGYQTNIAKMADSKNYIQSIEEYGGTFSDSNAIYRAYSLDKSYLCPYDTRMMGLGKDFIGIKINQNIQRYGQEIKQDPKNKLAIMESLEDSKTLFSRITPEPMSTSFFETHALGVGYIQDPKFFMSFILSSAITTNKANVDLFVNGHYFADIEKQKDLLQKLKEEKIHSIEIIDKKGEKKIKLTEKPESGGRVLRLVDLAGISEPDKEKMLALSDIISASGDTSYSELISAKKFPFFHPRQWKKSFFVGMRANMEEHFPEAKELIKYIQMTIEMQGEDINNDLFDYLRKNREKISSQWDVYCDYVHKNRNLEPNIDKTIVNCMIASVLQHGTKTELDELVRCIPDCKLGQSNFVFYAIQHKNKKLLNYLYDNHREKFNKLMNAKNSITEVTPFLLAAKLNDTDLAIRLMSYNACINDKDISGRSIIQYAIINNNMTLFKEILRANSEKKDHFALELEETLQYAITQDIESSGSSDAYIELLLDYLAKSRIDQTQILKNCLNYAAQRNASLHILLKLFKGVLRREPKHDEILKMGLDSKSFVFIDHVIHTNKKLSDIKIESKSIIEYAFIHFDNTLESIENITNLLRAGATFKSNSLLLLLPDNPELGLHMQQLYDKYRPSPKDKKEEKPYFLKWFGHHKKSSNDYFEAGLLGLILESIRCYHSKFSDAFSLNSRFEILNRKYPGVFTAVYKELSEIIILPAFQEIISNKQQIQPRKPF